MWWSLGAALAGSVCSGFAAVVQAIAARSVADQGRGLHPSLLVALFTRRLFLLGIGLDLLGFVGTFAALRALPLFLVQSITAANLVVTALAARWILGTRLSRLEWVTIVAVCVGLSLLGLSASPSESPPSGTTLHIGLLAAVGVLAGLGFLAGRLPRRPSAAALGLLAGFGFGLSSLASRVLTDFAPLDLLRDPAMYTLPASGLAAFLFFATALQRESVAAATAGTVVGQTVLPALVGILLLGDQTRAGLWWFGVAGFVIATAAALMLARFGDLTEDVAAAPTPPGTVPIPAEPGGVPGGLGEERGRAAQRAVGTEGQGAPHVTLVLGAQPTTPEDPQRPPGRARTIGRVRLGTRRNGRKPGVPDGSSPTPETAADLAPRPGLVKVEELTAPHRRRRPRST
jgi:drug/metabolite transporter (DMT)-like permease